MATSMDLQVMFPKINDLAQSNQALMNRNDSMQQQLAQNIQKNVEQSAKGISDLEKTDKTKVDISNEGRSKAFYKENEKKKKKREEENGDKNTEEGSTIDIRI